MRQLVGKDTNQLRDTHTSTEDSQWVSAFVSAARSLNTISTLPPWRCFPAPYPSYNSTNCFSSLETSCNSPHTETAGCGSRWLVLRGPGLRECHSAWKVGSTLKSLPPDTPPQSSPGPVGSISQRVGRRHLRSLNGTGLEWEPQEGCSTASLGH